MIAIANAIDWVNKWLGYILAPLIAALTIVVIYDIGLRFFIGRPSDWAFEVSKQIFAVHFMLLAAYGLYTRAHVEVDVVKTMFSKKTQAWMDVVSYFIFFLPFISIYLVYTWSFALRSWTRGETTYGMVAIPVYPVKIVMVIAGIALALQALALVLRAISRLREE